MSDRRTADSDPSVAHRLPYAVEPRRYDLRLAPDLDSASFSGQVHIAAGAIEPVSTITLNAAELEISSAVVIDAEGLQHPAQLAMDEENERVVLLLDEPLGPEDIEIHLEFSGTLNDQLHGFYRSVFKDASGTSHTIAATQFEATDARRAFPCFDEPDRKAVFSVTLDVSKDVAAFSNSPVEQISPLGSELETIQFADTIPMSSYLVACVVGDFVATDPVHVDGIDVRVVHTPGKEDLCDYALEVAAHALRFFTDWFGLPYPGQKLDLVAIPDFAFGAMENLGCITFREVALLVDPQRASRLELQRVADVISHEIAHMWFGDLVTMKWWNGIWLNEAFATFMEILCVDAFRPGWQRWTSFGLERGGALAIDALHSTRPVEYPVGSPEEAQGMFDVLTYQKGASVLRMLERYLGADRFRDGVRRYLEAHRLSNTETADLWDALEAASDEPVREIMDSWILQGGFPLVSLAERAANSSEQSSMVLSQKPFSYGPSPTSTSAIGSLWQVPVMARFVDAPSAQTLRVLLGSKPATLADLAPGEPSGLVLLNSGGEGYYRVGYGTKHLRRLAGTLGSLDALERSNLVSDTWAGVVAGHYELGDFLDLAEAIGDDADPDVWFQVTSALGFLYHTVQERTVAQLAAYTRELLGPAFARIGWEPERHEDERIATLRAQLLGVLGTFGEDSYVRSECARLLKEDEAGRSELDPDLAGAVVGVVARTGGEAEFDSFVSRMRQAQTPQEELRYRSALAAFTDPKLAQRAYEMAMTEIRSQDAPFLVLLLLSSRENGPATWERVRRDWDELIARIPANSASRMLEGVRLICRDRELADEITRFCEDHPLRAGQRSVDQTLERLGVNVSFAERLADNDGGAIAAGVARLERDQAR
jgi:puromycin-sensitive aminopeptidase